MKLQGKEMLKKGIKAIALIALCAVIVDVTQVAAMAIVVGVHESGHALTGVLNGEQLARLPSITFTGLFPQDVRGLTQFVDNSKGTQARVNAGPFFNLIMGLVIVVLLLVGTKLTGLLKKGRYAGFIIEALILLLFWSGWAIVSQFIRSPGTDLGGAVANGILGEAFFFVAVLIGVMIMISLTFDRFLNYIVKVETTRRGKADKFKFKAWLRYLTYLAFSILAVVMAPDVTAFFLSWLFMIVTGAYYLILLLIDNYNLNRIGQDLNYPRLSV